MDCPNGWWLPCRGKLSPPPAQSSLAMLRSGRGEYHLSWRFMKPRSSSGPLGWPLPRHKTALQNHEPNGTASPRERKSSSRKLQLPPLKFRRRLSLKVPSEPRFPIAVGWLWGRVIKFRNAVEPLKLVPQAGKHLIPQNGGQQNQKSHDNSEPGC